MLDTIKGLVKNKEEIVTEEFKTVKMLVPMSFELVDGKCKDETEQTLYDFLCEREDVIQDETVEEQTDETLNQDYYDPQH